MRILLAQNLPHLTGHGGAIRANRLMLAQLAAQGRECRVVAPLGVSPERLRSRVAAGGGTWLGEHQDAFRYRVAGVSGDAVVTGSRLVRHIWEVVDAFQPDWVLVPSDDPGGLVLGAALVAAPTRVVYQAYTLQQLPFGPRAFQPSPARTELIRQAAGVVAISRAAQEYLRRWGGLQSEVIYSPVYGEGPFPIHHGDSVALVNPCGYKGIDIFLGLADAFPDTHFLAVASWGTTASDRRSLSSRRNIEVVEAADDVDDVLVRVRVLLVPSLWDETFGYIVVEAMLRGIPVMASAVGGLREAKLDVPYLLPVRLIQRYDFQADPARPVPVIPEQDLAPWVVTLRRLLDDGQHRADVAARSRAAAARFVAGLRQGALDRYLRELVPSSARIRAATKG